MTVKQHRQGFWMLVISQKLCINDNVLSSNFKVLIRLLHLKIAATKFTLWPGPFSLQKFRQFPKIFLVVIILVCKSYLFGCNGGRTVAGKACVASWQDVLIPKRPTAVFFSSSSCLPERDCNIGEFWWCQREQGPADARPGCAQPLILNCATFLTHSRLGLPRTNETHLRNGTPQYDCPRVLISHEFAPVFTFLTL